MRLVAGLDLSLASPGVAVVHLGQPAPEIYWHNHIVKGKRGDEKDLGLMADRIATQVNEVLLAGLALDSGETVSNYALIAVERASYGSSGGAGNERAGLWWQVVSALWELGIPLIFPTPNQRAKFATDDGKASKQQVFADVVEAYGDLIQDPLPPKTRGGYDVADAISLAAIAAQVIGYPLAPASKNMLDVVEKQTIFQKVGVQLWRN